MSTATLEFRAGRASDVAAACELFEEVMEDAQARRGDPPVDAPIDPATPPAAWRRQRPLLEFIAALPGTRAWVCENREGLCGYAMVTRFGTMEELSDVMVSPSARGLGIGRGLLERLWPQTPSPELGRVLVAAGATSDLSLHTAFGVMPATGHWHLRTGTAAYVERRSHEIDVPSPEVHVLEVAHAVSEWKRLEPPAIGHERPLLHEFFGRTRSCLAALDHGSGRATALCWVTGDGDIGPAVGASAEQLVPVVVAALDRVAQVQAPEWLGVDCTTDSWWLLRRLRELGFLVYWPSWVLSSVPLPGLDRYLPTRPARLL